MKSRLARTVVWMWVVMGWAAAGPAPVAAQARPDLMIAAGLEGGYYHDVARRLSTLLAREHGFYVPVEATRGSLENLFRLDDPENPVSVALTQADALLGYLEEHPAFASEFLVLADVGRECAFLVSGRAGIETAAELKEPGSRTLSVGRAGSGAAVTWDYLTRLEPDFKNTEAGDVDLMEALAQLRTGAAYTDLAGIMMVQRPRVVSPAMEIVLKHPEDYRFIPIRETDIRAAALPSGKPVYTFETVSVREVDVETICTRALVLASSEKLDGEKRSRLAQVLLESSDYIAPGAD